MEHFGNYLCAALCALILLPPFTRDGRARPPAAAPRLVPKFPLAESGLELERRTQAGAFLDVLGRRAAVYGYERRQLEAWAYPLQILDQFELSFRLEGYPVEVRGADTAALINVRPEATTVTYSHAAFTVRRIIYAPVSEPGVVMLLDVDSVLPLSVSASFRPRLKLMWPAGLMTGSLDWDEEERAYLIAEDSGRFAGVVGSPAARDVSVVPYQEEPRDLPARFQIEAPAETWRTHFAPVVIAGSVRGRDDALATYRRRLATARALRAERRALPPPARRDGRGRDARRAPRRSLPPGEGRDR